MIFNISSEFDQKLINITFKLSTDKIKGTTLNASFELFKPLENAILFFDVYLPDSDYDQKYQRKLFQSNMDVSKILRGVRGNIIISMLVDALISNFDFEVKFPIKEGKHTFSNFICPDALFPGKPKRYKSILKFTVKIKEFRKPKWLLTVTNFGKII